MICVHGGNEMATKKNTKVEEVKAEVEESKVIGYVNCFKLNMRSNTNMDAKVITILDQDTKLEVANSKSNAWLKAKTLDGKFSGYVMAEYISY